MPIEGSLLSKEEAMINTNKYVDITPMKKNEDKQQKEEEDQGRKVMYQPRLVFTPVLTGSDRKVKETRHDVISEEDMNALNNQLAGMLIDDKEDNAKRDDKDSNPKDSKKDSRKDESSGYFPLLGRFLTTIFNYKTCKTSTVKRSARILANCQSQIKVAA